MCLQIDQTFISPIATDPVEHNVHFEKLCHFVQVHEGPLLEIRLSVSFVKLTDYGRVKCFFFP